MSCAGNDEKKLPEKGFVSWLPASTWEEALLSGNGTLGAMVMGYPFEEKIIVNHALLYLPNDAPLVPPDMAIHLDEIRKLSFDGKWEEAAKLGVKIWEEAGYGPKRWTDPYVPAADISISMPATNVVRYQRGVNFKTAEAIVDWTDENGDFSRKTFVSRADGVIVTQITGSGAINAIIDFGKHPHSWEQNAFVNSLIKKSETKILEEGLLQYHCEYAKPHSHSPKGYNGLLKVKTKGGSLKGVGNKISVSEASEVMIITSIEPFYKESIQSLDSLSNKINAINADYSYLLERQKQTHGEIYNRMSLNLYPSEKEQNMTSEILALHAKEKTTPGIIQRQFEAARYNILCATGINPPNLQGIWSGTWTPPWSGDFTHDGNVQVAISNLLNGNMQELMSAYFDHHERFLPDYRINAKQFYGARGIHVPSHTSTHGFNNHYGENWCLEYWNGGAAWTASYFYDYFQFTLDTTFLKERAFPFMTEALEFWEDFLVKGEDGKYISVPSYSPENNPLEHHWQNCINATMDIALVKELTNNWIAAAKILGIDTTAINVKRELLKYLPDYEISKDGVLKEWMWPGFTDNQAHRHASHLYGLYEVPDASFSNSEKLRNAAIKTINERMKIRKEQQGGEMAFGMCHLGFASVNLGERETATEIVEYLSRFYWTNGMATTHNPGNLLNMDISGGFPSLITRMLVNSRPGQIDILPALPEKWEKGEAKGIRCRGNIEVNQIIWNPEKVVFSFTSGAEQSIGLKLGQGLKAKQVKINNVVSKEKNNLVIEVKKGVSTEVEFDL